MTVTLAVIALFIGAGIGCLAHLWHVRNKPESVMPSHDEQDPMCWHHRPEAGTAGVCKTCRTMGWGGVRG